MVCPIMGTGSKICTGIKRLIPRVLLIVLTRYNVNPNHGTSDDLLALSEALHERGMYLMVDVVANHMVHYLEQLGGIFLISQ